MYERRREIRISPTLRVDYRLKRPFVPKHFNKSLSKDVSRGGVKIDTEIEKDKTVVLKIYFPKDDRPIPIEGVIMWSASKVSGIKFTGSYKRSRNRISRYIQDNFGRRWMDIENNFIVLSRYFSDANRAIISKVIYEAMKLLWFKERRLKKPQLKPKEVAAALELINYHYIKEKRMEVKYELAENFGDKMVKWEDAIKYYREKVCGTVKDIFDREIVIDYEARKSLFKDPITQKHIIKPENYVFSRGKRLPWIKPVIKETPEVYESFYEGKATTYYYTSIMEIPLHETIIENYFIVIVKKSKGTPLKFITAYHTEDYLDFLSKICLAHVYKFKKIA